MQVNERLETWPPNPPPRVVLQRVIYQDIIYAGPLFEREDYQFFPLIPTAAETKQQHWSWNGLQEFALSVNNQVIIIPITLMKNTRSCFQKIVFCRDGKRSCAVHCPGLQNTVSRGNSAITEVNVHLILASAALPSPIKATLEWVGWGKMLMCLQIRTPTPRFLCGAVFLFRHL